MTKIGKPSISGVTLPAVILNERDELVDGNALFENLCGCKIGSLKSKPLHEILNGNSRSGELETGSVENRFTLGVSGNGKKTPVRLERVPFVEGDAPGQLVLFLGENEEEARLSDSRHMARLASLGKVLSGVIHELSNSLAVVNGCAHLLAMEKLPSAIEEPIRRLSAESQRSSELVKKVLSFSRKEKSVKRRFHLQDAVLDASVLKSFSLKNDRIKILNNIDPSPPLFIEGYKAQITQVVLNLMSNSEQAIRDGQGKGCISLDANANGKEVLFRVADDGPGISAADKKKIFDAFYTTKDDSRGTGLGLYISRRIVEEHGGALDLAEGDGPSTVFQIRLPLAMKTPDSVGNSRADQEEAGMA